jgi:hypothetical protein
MPARIPDTLRHPRDRASSCQRSTGNLSAFREMQTEVREVDRLRVQIAMRVAAIAPACQNIDQAI